MAEFTVTATVLQMGIGGAAKHILVVESNPDDAFLIRKALKELPICTSFLCRSVAEARTYLSRGGTFKDVENYPFPDAVITELRLGSDSGYELLIWMRENSALRKVAVYVIASAVSPNDAATLEGIGVKSVIVKPTDSTELKNVLRQVAEDVCSAN